MRIQDLERVKEQALAHSRHQEEQLVALANQLQAMTVERDEAKKTLSDTRRNFAWWRLRTFWQQHPETEVTIRYTEARDLPIVDAIRDALKQHMKADPHIDGKNDPILRPDQKFKVLVSAGGFQQFETVAAALSEGGFVDCVVGQRMSGVDDYSRITIEVLPTVPQQ